MIRICFILSLLVVISYSAIGQIIKGEVMDNQSETPLIGATIELISIEIPIGTTSDIDGRFSMEGIPVGRHVLRISYLGYETTTIPNLLVTKGKDLFVEIALKEAVVAMDEVVVTSQVSKEKSNNELATISSRQFSLEEVTRYSGGRNDASRMAANFAGVNIANDSRNDIVIRGNSPTGVLWRLEGIPIPNPNHFATFGTTGGPVSALNTNLLSNSDFMTSAFPAEYGNASAGVFDIKFRSGNRDRFEFTAQLAAFSGIELMAEGPLSSKKKGSFVGSYRHSFVELAQYAGINVGTTAIPNYRDFTFKLDFGKKGKSRFSMFGLGATSNIEFIGSEIEETDFFSEQNQDSKAISKLGIIGVNHNFLINNTTYIKTSLSGSIAQNQFEAREYQIGGDKKLVMDFNDINGRVNLNSFINKKFSAKHTFRAGVLSEIFILDVMGREFRQEGWRTLRDFEDGLGLYQLYGQSQYRFNEKLTLNTGIHVQYLAANQNFVAEPRMALNWNISEVQTINVGYGIHHQMLPLPIYLFETQLSNGARQRLNSELPFTKSQHFVLGYDRSLGPDWRLKLETYLQLLDNIPVDQDPSSFSLLNVGDDFGFPLVGNLKSEGSGKNYGIELTVEKFFSKGYYGLLTSSLYDSRYKGSDRIERSTSFNNQYIVNLLVGKEFKIGKDKRNALTFDMKFTTTGGRYFTPIDLELSRQFNREIKQNDIAFSDRYDPYLRLDLKFGFQLNSKKRRLSQQFYLDLQNVTNHKNVFIQRYNEASANINTVYQIGFFPDILYRVQF